MKDVVSFEGNESTIRMSDMDAGTFQGTQIHIPGIHELHDDYPKDVPVIDDQKVLKHSISIIKRVCF